jgi:hypothetical protein
MAKLFWVREDEQGTIPMGEYASAAEARGAEPAALAALLDQCADDQQRKEIHRGRFEIEHDQQEVADGS